VVDDTILGEHIPLGNPLDLTFAEHVVVSLQPADKGDGPVRSRQHGVNKGHPGKPRQNFRYAGGELTRPCLAGISLTSPQGRTAAA
jgi:hypothetical protein